MTWGALGTLAAILGACLGVSAGVQAWLSRRTIQAMHRETQRTLAAMDRGRTPVLDRMDARAEARARDRTDRLGGDTEAPRC